MKKEAPQTPPLKNPAAQIEPSPNKLTKILPPAMVPTNKTGWTFGAIFVIVVIIGLLRFPSAHYSPERQMLQLK